MPLSLCHTSSRCNVSQTTCCLFNKYWHQTSAIPITMLAKTKITSLHQPEKVRSLPWKKGLAKQLSAARGLMHHPAKALLTHKITSLKSLSLKKTPMPKQPNCLEKPSPNKFQRKKFKTNPSQKGELGSEPPKTLHVQLSQDYLSTAGQVPALSKLSPHPFRWIQTYSAMQTVCF